MKIKTLVILTFIINFSLQAQCTDLFFSEYIEGSSSNKAFEIYNSTDNTIDLTNYVVYRHNNGSLMPSDSLFFQGSLPSKGIFTVVNPSADAVMLAVKDTTHSITFYNGDDAIWLKNITTLDTLDIIGEIGVDPGSGWVVGTGATNNTTLVRKFEIQKGQKDWSIGAIEWDVFPINMTDSLATHNMATCVSANVNQNSILTSVRVYPNPTNGNINISLNKTCRRILINVFDISGHKVFKSNHANKKYINFVLNQKSGLYFIEIRIGKQSSITKLILK